MRLLSLDISTSTGWAIFENGSLIKYGLSSFKSKQIDYKKTTTESMKAMVESCRLFSKFVCEMIKDHKIDQVVIEQTNNGRARFTQKMLEWLHWNVCESVNSVLGDYPNYMDSSEWRKLVGLALNKEDKANNKAVSKKIKKGKITKKHLAVRIVNDLYNLSFKLKDNDKADAILLGRAYLIRVGECRL